MDLSETELPPLGREAKIIETLALALDIAITVFDQNDKLIAVSSQFQRFFNIPSELLVPGARLRDVLGGAYDAGAGNVGSLNGVARIASRDDWIAERIAAHWRERHESVEQLADGRWVRLRKRRMPGGFLVSTIEDVSEQIRRDAELSDTRQQAELAQHILDNLATPVVVKDSSLRYVTVNEAFCRIPGLPSKHVIGRSAKDLVSPELARQFDTIERKVLDTGVPYEAAEDITRRDGSIMHVVTRIRRSGSPGKHYITITFDDISGYVQPESRTAETAIDPQNQPPESGSQAGNPERVLVLHADWARGERRVAAIKGDGSDAFVLCHATDAFAFLAQAEKMQIRIDRVELCDAMAAELASLDETTRYPVLISALKSWSVAAENKTALPAGAGEAKSSKPVQQKQCETGSALAALGPEPASASHAPVRPPEPLQDSKVNSASGRVAGRVRILVAEDNHVNQIVFEQILEGIDADFRIVCNGEEAIAAWQASAPDLILMDVSMPVMNGLQATQAIRKAEEQETGSKTRTPIIAVTAHAMGGDRERCLNAGMDDYLSKPVSPDKLEAAIAQWVETTRLGGEDSATFQS